MRQVFIFTILFFGVICFCFAQQDRPSDKDVKQIIENVEKGRDRFEDATHGSGSPDR
ncbi:hypothetical protein L0156_00920 [bacterium]|nr:hypothetical protein [bacterium]